MRDRFPGTVHPTLLPGIVGASAVLFYLLIEQLRLGSVLGFPLDDSWIHLQFAGSLAAGEGLAYNPGEWVTGSTSPLWTALLSLFLLLPGAIEGWSKLLGAAAFLATLHAVSVWTRELGLERGYAVLANVLVALTSWMSWSALSGMEIGLFTWLSLWVLILAGREHRAGSPAAVFPTSLVVAGLATLVRPEGLLLLILVLADRHVGAGSGARWGETARALLCALLLLLPVMTFFYFVGGSVLPTTFVAKAGLAGRAWWPSGRYLYTVLGIFMRPQPWLTLLAGAGILRLLERRGKPADTGLLPGLWLVGLPLAYSILSPRTGAPLVGNFGRYFFPLFPILVVLGVLGLAPAAERLRSLAGRRVGGRVGGRGGRRLVMALGAIILLAPTLWTGRDGAGLYVQSVSNIRQGDVRMALWLRQRLDAKAVIAVQDVGALKYFLPNRVIDLAGIVSPDIQTMVAEAMASGDASGEQGIRRFLEAHRPDYLVVFRKWAPRLAADESLLRPLLSVEIPGNIALGDSEIVLYATRWNRFPLRVDS